MTTVSPVEEKDLSKRNVLLMTLNCIQWWGSSSGDLGSVEYFFISITPKSMLTQSNSTR